MEVQEEKTLITPSLIGLRAYAEHLAYTDLEAGREKIGQIRFLPGMLASYHCVAGYEKDADAIIQREYLVPLDSLLEGRPVAPAPDFNEAHMAVIMNGLCYYREELALDREPVYEPDIAICGELIDEMAMLLKQEETPEWGAICMLGRQ